MDPNDYDKAAAVIADHPDLQDFVGPRPEDLVQAAEAALSVRLPGTYRRFLLEFGAGSFGSAEIYGVIDSNFRDSSVPNGIWYTLTERQDSGLEPGLVIVGNDGTGNLLCLDCGAGDDPPVVLVEPGRPPRQGEAVAKNFGAFLLDAVSGQVTAA